MNTCWVFPLYVQTHFIFTKFSEPEFFTSRLQIGTDNRIPHLK